MSWAYCSSTPEQDLSDGELGPKREAGGFSSTVFADEAVKFIQTAGLEQPFFLYVAFMAPHDPRNPSEKYRRMYYDKRPPLPENFLPQHPFQNAPQATSGRDESLAPWPRTKEVISDQLCEYYGLVTHLDVDDDICYLMADEYQLPIVIRNLIRNARDAMHPYGAAGPNAVFAMITQAYMAEHGIAREDFGRLCMAQRHNAMANPTALLRRPLSMDGYLGARPISLAWLGGLQAAGWVLQFIGHGVYEKRSPAFVRNLVHLLIGPLWILRAMARR